tara:strand:- start:473 stop:1462 length:990 start_codon:yes stop_codon:yes gene_type:complete
MIYKSYKIEQDISVLKSNIVLFYGENLGLKNDFKNKIKKLNPKANVSFFSQEEILKSQNNFFNELLNLSLFNEEKVYFINQINDKILNLIENLEQKIGSQKIYLFAETLDKKSKLRVKFEKSEKLGIIACYGDTEINLKKIVLDKLKGYYGLSTENINLIIDNCNFDRVKLNNELDKIKTFFVDKKIDNLKLIELLNLKENDNFNLLKDAVLSGNNKKTNKLLSDTFIETDKSLFYLNSINQRLLKLNLIHSVKDKPIERAVSDMRPPIFWKDKPMVIEQAKKWNSTKIKYVLKETFDLEIRFRSDSRLDKNVSLRKLLVDICNQANFS